MTAMSYIIRDISTGNYLKQDGNGDFAWAPGKRGAALFSMANARKMCAALQKQGSTSLKLYTVTGGLQG